ncbi:molybdate transporter 1 [Apiospora arundinis]|uniref:Sulfate transporter n=1 Tax=Apiospora arundinis TaxID=335852 RepID=A0ABR2JIA7_9PEZI
MTFTANIRKFHRNNVSTLRRSPLSEISGALGDLGTLLPLMIALAINGSISLSTTLVFSGMFNLITGVIFGIPLPVQPMKAIAAAAIASHTSLRETMAAGSVTSIIVLVLSLTGLLQWFTRVIPVPVIKGIQFGAGLSLIISAGTSLLRPLPWFIPQPLDNLIWALAAFILLIATLRMPRFPYALLVFAAGVVMAFIIILTDHLGYEHHDHHPHGPDHHHHHLPWFGIWRPYFVLPNWTQDAIGMGIAQLPLTTLNSVIAASALAADLLPDLSAPSVTALGTSVALMNLTGCWFGAMPVCHGAGGLAAQYRFGARSGASIIMLGLLKVVLGLVFGETLFDLLGAFPRSLLGIMVVAAGLELAKVGQSLNHGASDLWDTSSGSSRRHRDVSDEERSERWVVMLVTTAGILAFKNDAVGFLAGMFCHWAYRITEWMEERRERGRSLRERTPLLR